MRKYLVLMTFQDKTNGFLKSSRWEIILIDHVFSWGTSLVQARKQGTSSVSICNFSNLSQFQIATENYFCVRHKNYKKRNQHFELPSFMINLHFGTSNYLSKYRK